MIALLERIAFQTQGGPYEFRDYLEKVVVPNAITEWDALSRENNKQRQKDTPSIRTGQQQGYRGKKSGKWGNPFSG